MSEAQQGQGGNGITDRPITRRGVLRGGLVGTGLVILGAGPPTARSAIRSPRQPQAAAVSARLHGRALLPTPLPCDTY